jgi:curved DNA-binding protein CbpA
MDEALLQRLLAWADVLDDSSYYEILGVLEICDGEALREAYHQFALSFHPDVHRSEPPEIQAKLRRIFERGTEGYRVLTDPELRVKYDMSLARGKNRLDSAVLPRNSNAPPPVADTRPLDALARSAGAKLSAQKAAKLIAAGDLESALAQLKHALAFDGGANIGLEARIEALELALYAGGRD